MVACACSPSYSVTWGGKITGAQEVKAAVSHDHATALQPGWQSKTSVSKEKKKYKQLNLEMFFFKTFISFLKYISLFIMGDF